MRLSLQLKQRKFLVKDGTWLAVFRPKDPELALKLAEDLIGTPYEEAKVPFDQILEKQPYQFVGYASRRKNVILDADGKVIGPLKTGDSFVSHPQIPAPNCFRGAA